MTELKLITLFNEPIDIQKLLHENQKHKEKIGNFE